MALEREFAQGDSTEHSHRPALKMLLESFKPGIQATNEPRQIAGNAPDFVVRHNGIVLGNAEAKDIGEDLGKALKSPQLKRYREALPNLLLTDYLDFVWLRQGEEVLRVRVGQIQGRHIRIAQDADKQWQQLATAFFNEVAPTVNTPKQLAFVLAGQTRLLHDLVSNILESSTDKDLKDQHEAFAETLVPELTIQDFADMFSQTVTYGLFTARVFDPTPLKFSLTGAESLIPKANPFLRRFFQYITGPDLTDGVKWLVEQIAATLQHADMDVIIHKQMRKAGFEDPIFHFYETFLAEYDPKLREQRGVYYTPSPVVEFIVKAVDHLLKTRFNKPEGVANADTIILDPAVGTATFLRRVIDGIYKYECDNGRAGAWPGYVHAKLLGRLFGFELMMAPYTVAHLKLALQLADQGVPFEKGERLNVYLTNTLDRVEAKSKILFGKWLAEESHGAEDVKDRQPVQVVLGNPPYSGESRNKSHWIMALMDDYKKEPDGTKLKEKNAKWLNDDYVKFIRFAHWRISQTGHGIVAYITNHSWLDNPTFRGMRAALLRDFDEIFVIDLHGNAKKKERTPDSLAAQGEDKNIFDIEQGVAIVFLIRKPGHLATQREVYHTELWGSRDHKYDWLHSTSFESAGWTRLEPALPHLQFLPSGLSSQDVYNEWWSITDIFPVNSVGIVTARDSLTIHFTRSEVRQTVTQFVAMDPEQARERFDLGQDARDWKVALAQEDVRQSRQDENRIVPMLYRPFDVRWTYFTGKSKGFHCMPRGEVMRHMLDGQNVALIAPRQVKEDWAVFAANSIGGHKTCSAYDINYYFPLWLLPNEEPSLDTHLSVRRPNFNPKFLEALAQRLGLQLEGEHHLPAGISADAIFGYVYAVLNSGSYRQRYAKALRVDFARVPLPVTLEQFEKLSALGLTLVGIHLLRDKGKPPETPAYPKSGTDVVERAEFVPTGGAGRGSVFINENQYFGPIARHVWEAKMGGYQVLDKWLKDRKGRKLSHDDVQTYLNIVCAFSLAEKVSPLIDAAIAELVGVA